MLYVVSGLKHCCLLPCRLPALCRLLFVKKDQSPALVLSALSSEALRLIFSALSGVIDRPLCCSVLLAVLTSTTMVVAIFKSHAIATSTNVVCEGSLDFLLVMDTFFAFFHIGFALYVQRSVWDGVTNLAQKDDLEAPMCFTCADPKRTFEDLILDSFSVVFLYDVPFCLYLFTLLWSFSLNWFAFQWISLPGCNPGGWPRVCLVVGCVYPCLAVLFVFCWARLLRARSRLEKLMTPFGGASRCFVERPPSLRSLIDSGLSSEHADGSKSPENVRPGVCRRRALKD